MMDSGMDAASAPPYRGPVAPSAVNVANLTSGDFRRLLAVYQAAMKGDWDTAQSLFPDITELSTTAISSRSETALHIAVSTGKANDFVKKAVEATPREALCSRDHAGETALHIAAAVGNTEAAAALVDKNPDLLYCYNDRGRLAVQRAAISCQKETLNYLISKYVPNAFSNQAQSGVRLLIATIASQFLDVALDLAMRYPKLAVESNISNGSSALSTIAEMHNLFPRIECFNWWQKLAYQCIPIQKSHYEAAQTTSVAGDIENNLSTSNNNCYSTSLKILSRVGQKVESMIWNAIQHLVPKVKEMREKKATRQQALQLAEYLCHLLVLLPGNEASTIFRRSVMNAARNGNSEIVEMIMNKYPQIVFDVDDETGRNVFHLAASNRFENVINLIYSMNDRKHMFFDLTDAKGNNLLHMCGYLAPPSRLNLVAGAALQMQRELQWFKEMENFVHPSRRLWPNSDWKTPQMLFTEEHEKLKADGERWMKDTANACTIAAALISTVMFAAVFTVPGGLESTTGFPLLSTKTAFTIFAISDAVSLFTSITSLLMFLSILTSRYAEEDFLRVLPNRLSVGLLCLFLSITFMMVAFSATLYLIFRKKVPWLLVPVAAFACLPVTSFVLLQFPLLVDVLYSTYGPGIFGNKKIIKQKHRVCSAAAQE